MTCFQKLENTIIRKLRDACAKLQIFLVNRIKHLLQSAVSHGQHSIVYGRWTTVP